MAATVATAIKQMLEAAGLGVSVYRREAPDSAAFPYILITEGISSVPVLRTGRYAGQERVKIETVQADLYQEKAAEDYRLPDAVSRAFDEQPLAAGAGTSRFYGLTAGGCREVPGDNDDLLVQHSWDLDITRTY